jgi:hypothetical protein
MDDSDDVNSDADLDAVDSDDSAVDAKQIATERMAREMERNIAKQKEYASRIDRKMAKSEIKKRNLIDQQRTLREDLADDRALNNAELMSDVQSSSNDEDSALQFSSDEAEPVTTAGKDVESEGESV